MHAIAALDARPVTDPLALRDIDAPEPLVRENDLLIRVEAVSVNPTDVKRRSKVKADGKARILGFDGAGTVVGLGDAVSDFEVGDAVWWSGDAFRDGANADLQAVDHRIVSRKPASIDFADAASLPLTTITAWEGMFERMRINREDAGTLLMVGGAGGVGSILTQLAKRLTNLHVIATASREESAQWCRRMGADAVVNHRDLLGEVTSLAPGGIDYVFSSYTPGNIPAYAEMLRPFGQIVSIDGGALDLLPLFPKSIGFHWEYMFARSRYGTWDMAEQGRMLAETADLVDAGGIVPTATVRINDFSAAGILEAHQLVESGSVIGKVVIHR
ncbi:zinc-binding alcohol dehydrogenase family protein [Demequina litorisediminis]|uniref:Zinc-type alcohol dehydrogenase-like protein n=1 Tax=Demequina litorisediminis TaxID=1849022 RepID=A0ABQ6IIU5_9MICO|nr:zinc-binding alcohol dehydrogenase family protein [Demequina litorisediminis]GMA37311.1 NADPH:quinone reductase [Demequina litorisediminis]